MRPTWTLAVRVCRGGRSLALLGFGMELPSLHLPPRQMLCLEDANADDEDFYCPGQEYSRTPSPFESDDHERWYAVGPWHHIAHELAQVPSAALWLPRS